VVHHLVVVVVLMVEKYSEKVLALVVPEDLSVVPHQTAVEEVVQTMV
tara:strand:+ start:591 stop:731 length:141 start_codon:yes stop_codon:yes gene_type:complete